MKQFFLSVVCFLFAITSAFSQVGNEWINFNQPYYKIPVGKEGIYKLDFNLLEAAGLPVNSIDPTTFQLYHRGVEQAIHVEGESDQQFNTPDFIQFYGQQNDGTIDKELYKPSSAQPHAYYNLFSDTTYYFLTYGAMAGKRMEFFQQDNDGLVAEPFHIDDKLRVIAGEYTAGINYSEVEETSFGEGEGFTGALIRNNNFREIAFTGIVNTYPAGGLPELELLLVGRSNDEHPMEIYVGTGLRLLASVYWAGYGTLAFKQNIEWTDLAADGTLLIRVKSVSTVSAANRGSISLARLRYPQTFDGTIVADKIYSLADNDVDNSYLEFPNATVGFELFDISQPDEVVRIGKSTAAVAAAVIPPGTNRKILANVETIQPQVKRVSFRQMLPKENYIIISHSSLHQPGGMYADPVKAYAEYRASAQGGGYDTLVVDIQQLYDQFTYGEITPAAIFRFMRFFTNAHTPSYLFLIGKGLDVSYRYHRSPSTFTEFKDLVPSAGYPASDAFFTVGLLGTTYEPAVPTGRITASSPSDVAAYLDKIKETEARPFDDLRRKHILHLSGGTEVGEPERFRGYLEQYAAIAEDYYLGADVDAIAKQSFDIELINIADEVNKGLGLVTFYGHSSSTAIDFDVGKVSDPVMGYNNPGKYPFMLMNGCNVGSYFLNLETFSEDWVLTPQRGSVGFIAHTHFGFEQTIRRYSETLYRVAFSDSSFIDKGIGDIQKETAKRFMEASFPSPMNITQAQQMILLGDPALPLFGTRKADLEITPADISFTSFNEESVTAQSDSFAIQIIVRNYGMARPDTLQVHIKRYLNDNTLLEYDSLFTPVKYSDTLTFIIRKGRENAGGNNAFEITLDPDQVVREIRKDNNTVSVGLPIPLNGTKNLFPSRYSIVNETSVSLTFQATNVFSGAREFLVELDTLATFDSPFKKEFTTTANVLARQSIELLSQDSTAYYWRSKLKEPQAGESEEWTLSSFTYIENGPEGWAQIHFPQYLENATVGLVKDAIARELQFEETTTPVLVTTYGVDHVTTNKDVSVKIDNTEYHILTGGYTCRDNTINLIAFNKHSTAPYPGVYMTWYNKANRACGRLPWVINSYRYNELAVGNGSDLLAYVDNVAEGDSVLLFSIGNANYTLWPAAAKTKLSELGISDTQLSTLQNGEPLVIFGKKGLAPGNAKIFRASETPVKSQALVVDETITGGFTSGNMTSVTIGPAQQWLSFIAKVKPAEVSDATVFSLIGIKPNGEQVEIASVANDYDLSAVSAQEFPYLKIQYQVTDEINLTPAQLNNWFVLYTPVPEGLLLMDGTDEPVTVQEGEEWKGQYNFINVSDKPFTEAVTVKVDVFTLNSRQFDSQQFTIEPPLAGDTTSFEVTVNTLGKNGLNDLSVFVNPNILPEQYYDNNNLKLYDYLNVVSDSFRPVLDVTIDGRYLLDDDFVSPNPTIQVQVIDENPYILKASPEGIKIFLTYPCETDACEPSSIELTRDDISWQPATSAQPFTLLFKPIDLPAGNYTLRIEGADAKGNTSGIEPYVVSFVVSENDEIYLSEVFPNPSSGELNFKVVLEGNTLPTLFSMELMDMQGKVIGGGSYNSNGFNIGTNLVSWSVPKGAFPNGLYIYKLTIEVEGKLINKVGKVIMSR